MPQSRKGLQDSVEVQLYFLPSMCPVSVRLFRVFLLYYFHNIHSLFIFVKCFCLQKTKRQNIGHFLPQNLLVIFFTKQRAINTSVNFIHMNLASPMNSVQFLRMRVNLFFSFDDYVIIPSVFNLIFSLFKREITLFCVSDKIPCAFNYE